MLPHGVTGYARPMPSWDADRYLQFEAERTRPCQDLAARIAGAPARIVDLGCGPGNSTAVLAARWRNARLTGLDSSPAMIEAARKRGVKADWVVGDIAAWAAGGQSADLVFSNAAFQWVPAHGALIPALMDRVAPGGALAFQIPINMAAPAQEATRALVCSSAWRGHFPAPVHEWAVLAPEAYFDLLAPRAARLDLWVTEYMQVVESVRAIADWFRGTALRPYLDALADDGLRARFLADYESTLAAAYPARPSGAVIFPFRRFFAIAYR